MDAAELRALLGASEPEFRARQMYEALYRRRVTELDVISNIPKSLRARLAEEFDLGLPEIERRFDSADGTRRYLLRLSDGKTVETVWMPEAGRSTICISSQIGCPVNCRFCLTALLGLERNLTAGEIVGQVLRVCQDCEIDAPEARRKLRSWGGPKLGRSWLFRSMRPPKSNAARSCPLHANISCGI
jgi:23S rRNA (adenine2503-C2)-methyltransferase